MPRVALVAEARGDLVLYPVPNLRHLGVDAFVTSRLGGVSEGPYDSLNLGAHVGDQPERVEENRRRVARAIGLEVEPVLFVRQVHGATVLDARAANSASEADGLVSDGDTALGMLVADCVPVALADEVHVAVVHAGWRGLRAGVLAVALAYFADPSRVHAFVGPSVSGARYQVGPDVATHFAAYPEALRADVDDRVRLDLRLVTATQLLDAGVTPEHLLLSDDVTDDGETFFSDRAERPCGRFALVAKRAS